MQEFYENKAGSLRERFRKTGSGRAVRAGVCRQDLSGLSEDGDDVFDVHYEEAIVAFEIDRDCACGIEQHLVVLPQRYIRCVFDLN